RKSVIRESLVSFQGVEHRLEKVLKINHVTYINDSKATKVNSTYYALQSMTTPTVWIAGGTDKGNNYEELIPLVYEKVKAIICLGLDNTKLIQNFGNIVSVMLQTESMREAVHLAYSVAERSRTPGGPRLRSRPSPLPRSRPRPPGRPGRGPRRRRRRPRRRRRR